jgi:hypothetical protein
LLSRPSVVGLLRAFPLTGAESGGVRRRRERGGRARREERGENGHALAETETERERERETER